MTQVASTREMHLVYWEVPVRDPKIENAALRSQRSVFFSKRRKNKASTVLTPPLRQGWAIQGTTSLDGRFLTNGLMVGKPRQPNGHPRRQPGKSTGTLPPTRPTPSQPPQLRFERE